MLLLQTHWRYSGYFPLFLRDTGSRGVQFTNTSLDSETSGEDARKTKHRHKSPKQWVGKSTTTRGSASKAAPSPKADLRVEDLEASESGDVDHATNHWSLRLDDTSTHQKYFHELEQEALVSTGA